MLCNHIKNALNKSIQKKGEKQPTPFDTKQRGCTCIDEVEKDPNGKH